MFLIFGLLVFIGRNNVNAQLNSNLMPVASIDREISLSNYAPPSLMEKDKCSKFKKMKGIGMGLMIGGGASLVLGTTLFVIGVASAIDDPNDPNVEVSDENKTALQDIKDSLVSLILNYDEVLENANSLLNTYHSVNSQKSNDVMKLLTIFSAFFLPLTFVAGIYGMNFDHMPELRWDIGYYLTLSVMLVIVIVIFVWFKRKKII